ncbi:MAG TPA: hypothetical protein VD927_08590 [Chryseosolibacter sp.]|nr:hypothetical protein [Chryseosolibacter sp.]
MKMLILLASPLLFIATLSVAQPMPKLTFKVAPDTSSIAFDQIPRLSVTKVRSGRNVYFQMPRKDFKTMVATVALLQNMYELTSSTAEHSKHLIIMKDSMMTIMDMKYKTEAERSANVMKGFEELKAASQAQQDQLTGCIKDMERLNAPRKWERRKGYIKGGICGVIIGAVGALVVSAD